MGLFISLFNFFQSNSKSTRIDGISYTIKRAMESITPTLDTIGQEVQNAEYAIREAIESIAPTLNIINKKSQNTEECDFIVFDLETTGLNVKTTEIIEISALKVKNFKIIDSFSVLVKPKRPVDPQATKINNITNKMLEGQKSIEKVLPDFIHFVSNNYLLGYNIATFDIPILKRIATSIGLSFENDYIDVLHIARKKMYFLPNRKLTSIASYFTIDTSGAHRGLADCEITLQCYKKLLEFEVPPDTSKQTTRYHTSHTDQTQALQQLHALLLGIIADDMVTPYEVSLLNSWINDNQYLKGQFPYDEISFMLSKALSDGILEQHELDEMLTRFKEFTSPLTSDCVDLDTLFQKNICLTGKFEHGQNIYIEDLIISHGGIIKSSVSFKLDYLIVGALGSPDWNCGNYGSKIKRAKEIQSQNGKVKIITEEDLFNLIENNK